MSSPERTADLRWSTSVVIVTPHPTPTRDAARWPWPAPVRVLVGAAAGWLVVDAMQRVGGPWWQVAAAMAALAAVGLGASRLDVWAGRGITSGAALVTVAGLYLGPPETGMVVGLALGLGVLWLAEATGRARLDGLIAMLLGSIIVWAAIWGSAGRPSAIVGGVLMLGLLLVGPLALSVPGVGPGLPRPWDAVTLVMLQLLFVVGVARTAALLDDVITAAAITASALALLTLLTWAVAGGRPRTPAAVTHGAATPATPEPRGDM